MLDNLDEYWINRTIELAQMAKGKTSPNPMVGAVILDSEGNFVSEGFHQKAGTDHAEIVALKLAGERVRNGTIYINLEPCSHYGKTPPCAKAIIEAGLKRVVIGSLDPNPKVNGNGLKNLKEAGLDVTFDILKEKCLELNKFFFHWIQTGTPWVTLKVAASLNAKINDPNGNDKWITGYEARKKVHEMRAEYDVVLTGSGTILSDDPELTVRHITGRNPARVILDRRLRCSEQSKIFQIEGKNLLFTSPGSLNKQSFQNTEIIPWDGNLKEVLEILGQRNYLSVLVEAGQSVNTSFLNENLVNDIFYFLNPSFITTDSALNSYQGLNKQKFKIKSINQYNEDLLLVMTPFLT